MPSEYLRDLEFEISSTLLTFEQDLTCESLLMIVLRNVELSVSTDVVLRLGVVVSFV